MHSGMDNIARYDTQSPPVGSLWQQEARTKWHFAICTREQRQDQQTPQVLVRGPESRQQGQSILIRISTVSQNHSITARSKKWVHCKTRSARKQTLSIFMNCQIQPCIKEGRIF